MPRPNAIKESSCVSFPPRYSTRKQKYTYRRAHDFDFPHEPGLMEVLLCLIVDIRMIYPSLDPALALLIKLYRDSICILHQERGISHEYSKKDGSYFARETIHDAGFVWVVLKYVL